MTEMDWQNEAVWKAIDAIAAVRGISTSRLAIISGHNSTAFNKSKRVNKHSGEMRWPTMEAIAKVLRAANMTYAEFGALVDDKMGRRRA
jgi:hypothetical protein